MQILKTKRLDFASSVYSRNNIFALCFFSLLLTTLDTFQSYYLQRVVINPFSEANLIPAKFYEFGILGYIAYMPVEFLVTLGIFVAMWGFANYILWYYSRFVRKQTK